MARSHPGLRIPISREHIAIVIRSLGLAAIAACLFLPLFTTTVVLFHAPPPWRLTGFEIWAGVVTWVVAWIILPLTAGFWLRSWWWPLFTVLAIVAPPLVSGNGRVLFPDILNSDDPYTYTVEVETTSIAVHLGALAAIMAIIGTLLGNEVSARYVGFVRRWTTAWLFVAVVPVRVMQTVFLTGAPSGETGVSGTTITQALFKPEPGTLTSIAVLGVCLFGPAVVGIWLRAMRWPLWCVIGGAAVIVFWSSRYLEPPRSGNSLDAFFAMLTQGIYLIIAAWLAALGVGIGLRRERLRMPPASPLGATSPETEPALPDG